MGEENISDHGAKEIDGFIAQLMDQVEPRGSNLFLEEGKLSDTAKEAYISAAGEMAFDVTKEHVCRAQWGAVLTRVRREHSWYRMRHEQDVLNAGIWEVMEEFLSMQPYKGEAWETLVAAGKRAIERQIDSLEKDIQESARRAQTLRDHLGYVRTMEAERHVYQEEVDKAREKVEESQRLLKEAEERDRQKDRKIADLEARLDGRTQQLRKQEEQEGKTVEQVTALLSENTALAGETDYAKKEVARHKRRGMISTIAAGIATVGLAASLLFNVWQYRQPRAGYATASQPPGVEQVEEEKKVGEGTKAPMPMQQEPPAVQERETLKQETAVAPASETVPSDKKVQEPTERTAGEAGDKASTAPLEVAAQQETRIIQAEERGTSYWRITAQQLALDLGREPTVGETWKKWKEVVKTNSKGDPAAYPMHQYPPSNKDPKNPNYLPLGADVLYPTAKKAGGPVSQGESLGAGPDPEQGTGAKLPAPESMSGPDSNSRNRVAVKQRYNEEKQRIKAKQGRESNGLFIGSFRDTMRQYAQEYNALTEQFQDAAKADEEMLARHSYFRGDAFRLHTMMKRAVREFDMQISRWTLHLLDEDKLWKVYEMHKRFADHMRLDELVEGARRILGVNVKAFGVEQYRQLIGLRETPQHYHRPERLAA